VDIVLIAAEVAPWSKTGGLGDVCGALPKALAARGHRVMTVAPRYKDYEDAWETTARARIYLFGQHHEVRYYRAVKDGVQHVFVDHVSYRRAGIYGDANGAYGDNLFRFALLSRAGLEAPMHLAAVETDPALRFGERILFHANDWHTGLVPLYLDAIYKPAGRLRGSSTVLGLHNVGHQGQFSAHAFPGLDISSRWWPALDMDGNINLLKCGVTLARRLVAVSPTYAKEVTGPLGFGLGGVIGSRGSDVRGILNGIEPSWDPAVDPHLAARYTPEDLSGKAACKAALQREMGLPVRADVPVLGVVARLDHQKGVDLVLDALPWLLERDLQLVVLGSGSQQLSDRLREAARFAPHRVAVHIGFSEPLAHRIEAGADVFLMPSRFEPCGLNQLYSLKYGTVPVVHATGGLADTVETVDPWRDTGTGWAFRSLTTEAFVEALGWALLTYTRFPEAWARIQRRGMERDYSWGVSAGRYEALYAEALATEGG